MSKGKWKVKKLFLLLLATAMVIVGAFSLTACGGSKDVVAVYYSNPANSVESIESWVFGKETDGNFMMDSVRSGILELYSDNTYVLHDQLSCWEYSTGHGEPGLSKNPHYITATIYGTYTRELVPGETMLYNVSLSEADRIVFCATSRFMNKFYGFADTAAEDPNALLQSTCIYYNNIDKLFTDYGYAREWEVDSATGYINSSVGPATLVKEYYENSADFTQMG